MKIVTWNVNSINARLDAVLHWASENKPDVMLLQEIKCINEAFPSGPFEELGYNLAIHGQKTYNGVAILSKWPLEDIITSLGEGDAEARYLEAVTGPYRVASIYVPNGKSTDSDRFQYKLDFMNRLEARIRDVLSYDEMCIFGGDYNIAPYQDDIFDPSLSGSDMLLCSPSEQESLRRILHLGLYDAIRMLYPLHVRGNSQLFSWWDYRGGAFVNNEGFRIDHMLLSSKALDRLVAGNIDKEVRAQKQASDHAPVWITLQS
ncbi:MAG: exodeoxyribonuclease III [Candidatus Nucleicultricaceae bacterium]